MRILIISNYYSPHFFGDIPPACEDISKYLQQKAHKVFVLTGNYGISSTTQLTSEKSNILRLLKYVDYDNSNSLDRYLVDRFNFFTTKKYIKQVNPDLIFISDLRDVSLSPALAAQSTKIPKIFHFTELWIDEYIRSGFLSKLKRNLKKILPNTIGGTLDLNPSITNSYWLAEKLAKRYSLKKKYIVSTGVVIPKLEKPAKQDDIVSYLFSGTIESHHKIELILTAFDKLIQTDQNFEINLFGKIETSYLIKLKDQFKNKELMDKVHIINPNKDEDEVYRKNDVVILPTITPSSDVLIKKAMAFQMPIILPDENFAGEIIDDERNGYFFKSCSWEDLLIKIELLQNEPAQCKIMGENAYQTVSEKFAISTKLREIEEIIFAETNEQRKKR